MLLQTDREWVENSFLWLYEVFGSPPHAGTQFLITESHFPQLHAKKHDHVSAVISDLASILELDSGNIKYQRQADLRDTFFVPVIADSDFLDAETFVVGPVYHLVLSNHIVDHIDRLLFVLCIELIKIKLHNTLPGFEDEPAGDELLYMTAIYWGLGALICPQMYTHGEHSDLFWTFRWQFRASVPREVMAYGLALFHKMFGDESPAWSLSLPGEIRHFFDELIVELEGPFEQMILNKELIARLLLEKAERYFIRNQFEYAISEITAVPLLSKNDWIIALANNNKGYYLSRLGRWNEAINHYRTALNLFSDFGYANDNLGFALMQMGELDLGLTYIQKAMECEDNDPAYSYRNLAIYYWRKQQFDETEKYFLLAFEHEDEHVDLLWYYWGVFLMEQGLADKGYRFIKMAAEKGEPEALKALGYF